ncbi:MAG: alanine dehydrogenase [Crocinitomicaceae bacterium]
MHGREWGVHRVLLRAAGFISRSMAARLGIVQRLDESSRRLILAQRPRYGLYPRCMGTVGEFASRSAIGLGASVKVFDNSLSRLRRLQNDIGSRVYTSIIQPKVLAKAIRRADVVIGALRSPIGKSPCVVTESMIESMKEGSVVVDVSIDQGGCFETSRVTNHNEPTFIKYGVIHYCVPNIASRVSRTASFALSNIFSPLILEMGDKGGVSELIRAQRGFRNGVYVYRGILTNEVLGRAFDLKYKNIELLLPGI